MNMRLRDFQMQIAKKGGVWGRSPHDFQNFKIVRKLCTKSENCVHSKKRGQA